MHMSCSCGFEWESENPKDSVDHHMMYHKRTHHLVSVDKTDTEWHLTVALNRYPSYMVLDD